MSEHHRHSREELADIARRWIVAGWQRGDQEAVRALYAPELVDLSRPGGQPGTPEANIQGIAELYTAFPNFFTEIDDLLIDVESGKVAVRWSAIGTHRATFFGFAPTGKRIVFHGIEILTIAHGLIVERAGEWDAIEILNQLGATF